MVRDGEAAATPVFEQARRTMRRYELRWYEADAYRLWGDTLHRVGRPEQAAEAKQRALAILRRIDTPLHQSSDSGPIDGRLGNLSALSVREKEVLRWVAAGLSNSQIAERLVIGPSTVANHVSSVLRKTGATNRTEAAPIARTGGWTSAADER